MSLFDGIESNVAFYSRLYPAVFNSSEGVYIFDVQNRRYIDFLAGAGSLNYGHNNPILKKKLISYIESNGVTHGLDMMTLAKKEFLSVFHEKILKPRNLSYIVQFTGPTGTNSVEAALKICRNVTGRQNIIAFTNAFHGVTLGSLAVTGGRFYRAAAGVPLNNVFRLPYDGEHDNSFDSINYISEKLTTSNSEIDKPAGVIVEVLQGEGGLNKASIKWLQELQELCKRHGMLLIVDEIQTGCGRTGDFFSFEKARIYPDIVTLAKSLSGYGLPFAVALIKPCYDNWKPGQHNGTFRGNNLAFVTATETFKYYWKNSEFSEAVVHKSLLIKNRLKEITDKYEKHGFQHKGLGMMQGIDFMDGKVVNEICRNAFLKGVIVEPCGPTSNVLKILPPLIIDNSCLHKALDTIADSIDEVINNKMRC
ncbi:diaminobutyrate--2-oxoglutarate transaminase [Exilibacterium tricleocarpae]|uniref:Diaminobutyrate--2-oxoglutarate transaminase n=1 Tax=Exilibacterium tricleocarpae TaxID=2591008 RepID=A0A545TYU4_9GAMM|nr:diaminobutyrate--2-oxoglutarate transaminase [Exilibacterium tricleocarpae]TQV82390.1 diaminobutyrate--2-oxoglutarate transaminase [Exilibacterium tricleocarpae]